MFRTRSASTFDTLGRFVDLSDRTLEAKDADAGRYGGMGAGDRRLVYDLQASPPKNPAPSSEPSVEPRVGGSCVNPLKDELQNLLARLISQAHELGTRGIYRGEPECFRRISSGLYRELYEIDDQSFHIGSAQQRRIELARRYTPHLSDDDVLTHLQHLGGKTNLIDFTRDLNIALFFSSYDSPDKDGRIVLMEEPLVRRDQRDVFALYTLVTRGTPANMTDVQKSVWVEPRNGYIDEEDVTVIEIPSALKPEILSHLRVVYGVEASTVYNDLSGFIRDQDRLRDPDAEWHAGVRAAEAGRHVCALGFFARYEELVTPPRVDLQYRRAIAYWYVGRREEALDDMATFRSRSSHDPRAFPEEMESAYAERQRGHRADGLRRTGQDSEAPAAEVFPGFLIRLVSDADTPLRTRLRLTHETGAGREQPLDEKETFVTFPGLAPEAEGTWLLWLERDDYLGVDSQPMCWPVRETFVLEAIDGDAPDITVEIESLQYTYEPGIEGPLVAYPARGDGVLGLPPHPVRLSQGPRPGRRQAAPPAGPRRARRRCRAPHLPHGLPGQERPGHHQGSKP